MNTLAALSLTLALHSNSPTPDAPESMATGDDPSTTDADTRDLLMKQDEDIAQALSNGDRRGDLETMIKKRRDLAQKALWERLGSQINSEPLGTALQVLGQVVVDKALESGWSLVTRRIDELAGCGNEGDSEEAPLKNTCDALADIDIRDLIAKPETLVGAALQDLFGLEGDDASTGKLFTVLRGLSWKSIAAAWKTQSLEGAATHIHTIFKERLVEVYAEHPTCKDLASVPEKATWALGKCLVYQLDRCEIANTLAKCEIDPALQPQVLAIVSGWQESSSPKAMTRNAVNLVFAIELLDTATPRKETLTFLQDIIVGAIDRDANRALSAAGKLFALIVSKTSSTSDETDGECKASSGKWDRAACGRELFKFLIAVAQTEADDASAHTAAVKGLIARLTRRAGRRSGAVISLGGSFALIGGARLAREPGGRADWTYASPIHLGLGFGLDTYHSHEKAGLHVELSAVDLGQYVAISDGNVAVAKPDLRAAFAPSAKVGVHFALKETPLFLALFGGASPFIRTVPVDDTNTGAQVAGDRMTWTAGLTLGIYVPFLDFN